MSPTIELADQLFETGPVTRTSSCVEWVYQSDEWCLRIEAHAPGVFRLRCGPIAWLEPPKATARAQRQADMLLARHEAVSELECQAGDTGGWHLSQGDACLTLGDQGFALQLMRQQQPVARAQLSLQPVVDDAGDPVWSIDWTLGDTEGVFGLGETCADPDRRGLRLVSDDAADRCLPLAWTPAGWGVYANTLDRVVHDLRAPSRLQMQVHGAGLDVFLFVGDPGEILNQYTALTGRAGQPNLWPLGVWLDQAPGQTIAHSLQQVRSLRAQGLALDALRLADPAILGFQADKPVFEWSAAVDDWREIVAAAQEQNIHLAGSCIPGVLQGTDLFDEWEDRGWLLCDEDGNAWVCPGTAASGDRPFALLDLTHKDTARFWAERHQQALDDGLAAPVCQARFDFPAQLEARSGEAGAVLRTSYPHLARRALFDAVAGPRTPQEGVMLSRDLFPGVQRFAWQQGPDVDNSWDGYAQTLRAALSVGNAGVAVQTHALGCASRSMRTMTPELYLRWLAMSVFSANFSFQGHPDLMPDAFDASTRNLIGHWLQWRYRLLPYVAGIIDDAVRTGLPVQRSMAQAYPADPQAHAWDTQYLLGPALLVAPVMQPGGQAEIYLPEGDAWWDLATGWRYEGGTRWTLNPGLDALPVFGREGHMLCLGPVAQHTGEINSAKILEEVWMFGMPEHNPVVMRNKIRVMQMQGSSYIKGLEGLKILPSEGLEVKRRGAEVRISRAR
ncbi:glycoside hydrolase family 31 protein [Castellaniella sp.]|uniref:glycoside hydrolase family 31 protein n=1 Tax=Castellaniella sp. TaxID=1955812 RepID=UPI002AFF74AE|nr:glycoside hydrolase family 31 protein [Castellaniella sp.]